MFPAWYDCVNSTVMLVPSCAHGTITRHERIAQPVMRTSYALIVLHVCSMPAHVIHVPNQTIRRECVNMAGSYSYYPASNCDHPCLVRSERTCKIASSAEHVKEWWSSLLNSVFNACRAGHDSMLMKPRICWTRFWLHHRQAGYARDVISYVLLSFHHALFITYEPTFAYVQCRHENGTIFHG